MVFIVMRMRKYFDSSRAGNHQLLLQVVKHINPQNYDLLSFNDFNIHGKFVQKNSNK